MSPTDSSSSPPSSSWRLFEDYGDNDDYDLVDDEDESDDEREITDEELQQYKAAFEASDGFDVPSFPGVFCRCLVTPVVLDAYTRETLNPLCVAAMDHYNYEKKTDYQFLKLEKANAQGARGLLYYLTFRFVGDS
ncbi:uncharacterized protein LOC111300868 [Durio zibethinus]|uniref:Uncharacterized protein LOC111300868 n=1 Tax=Durio zibethinus TaxID=66656 RepID=A0A6P5ZHI8_DURZI|nr:uncharacterized protein LOC111300868 [Durio zibethinus]